MPAEHVAIVTPQLGAALAAGRKRIESRFFTTRRVPFGRVARHDTIHFKLSGGPVIGRCRVARVVFYRDLTPGGIDAIRRRYNHAILAPRSYWQARRNSRYGVLIWLGPFSPRDCDLAVPRQFGSGWIVVSR